MDYEKKYKEALEKARELDIKGIHIMRDVFPELEEPKDEKIRLSLINWIINDNQETFAGLKSSDVIEWLKRQKTPEWSEEDKEIIETICKEGDLKPSERVWLRSLKPQPKQEWSEEDEIGLGDTLWCIEQARKSAKDENDMGNCWSAESWINSFRLTHWKPIRFNDVDMKIYKDILNHLVAQGNSATLDVNRKKWREMSEWFESFVSEVQKHCNK